MAYLQTFSWHFQMFPCIFAPLPPYRRRTKQRNPSESLHLLWTCRSYYTSDFDFRPGESKDCKNGCYSLTRQKTVYFIVVFCCGIEKKYTRVETLAGFRSERMIPSSWMYFSPLTKSHPNFLTTSSCRRPSWPTTYSSEPPGQLTDSRVRDTKTGNKGQVQQCLPSSVLKSHKTGLLQQLKKKV